MRGLLAARGIAAPELILENGCGLSRVERISAATLGNVLADAWKSQWMSELMASLPISGVDGTMQARNVPAGAAHMKTGMLEDTRAVAGYVQAASGKRYVVVAIINHPNAGRGHGGARRAAGVGLSHGLRARAARGPPVRVYNSAPMSVTPSRVPVTVLTGFLGSGKTTLLNRILSEKHGKRIAVIENEFGEVGVDSELVIGAEEELFETNNGCICCTVRGDLIRILGQLMKRRDRFDYILIETTGMADPGPVAQTFFLDDELKNQFQLDAIVTMVDAKHFEQHVDELNEPAEQVAFADLVLLNKTDLVDDAALARIESRIRGINGTAKIHRTKNADVPIDKVLNVGAFDLNRALAVDEAFLEPEYPFEWGGVYQLAAGDYLLKTARRTRSSCA